MKTIQKPLSDDHQSAMFFDGVVATGTKDGINFTLKTFQDGEVGFNDKLYIGSEIRALGETGAINDTDIDEEDTVDIYVDKFFAITVEGVEVDTEEQDNIYNDYEEALEAFKDFLNE